MAESIIKGLLRNHAVTNEQIRITNRSNNHRLTYLEDHYGIYASRNIKEVISEADVIVVAIKPKDALDGLEAIRPFISQNQLLISVMAGVSTRFIENVLKKAIPVIRSMPNTSSEIGRSATTLCKGAYVTSIHTQITTQLFESIGTVTFVDEMQMDTTTAIAGSGPAYFYYIAEALHKAALMHGICEQDSRKLIAETLIGAGEMLKHSHLEIEQLRHNITSPGGTTAAGLQALHERNVDQAFISCILEAAQRSREMKQGG